MINLKETYTIQINDFLLYEFKLSLKLIETLMTIIDIAKHDRRIKCCYKKNIMMR
jgi:hypothetical protein